MIKRRGRSAAPASFAGESNATVAGVDRVTLTNAIGDGSVIVGIFGSRPAEREDATFVLEKEGRTTAGQVNGGREAKASADGLQWTRDGFNSGQ